MSSDVLNKRGMLIAEARRATQSGKATNVRYADDAGVEEANNGLQRLRIDVCKVANGGEAVAIRRVRRNGRAESNCIGVAMTP